MDLKDELRERKGENETYGDVIRRALETNKWLKRILHTQQQQARLQARMAVAMGLDKDQIPTDLAALESHGDADASSLDELGDLLGTGLREQSDESITDLTEEERQEKADAIAEAADENEGLHGATEEQVEAAVEDRNEPDEPSLEAAFQELADEEDTEEEDH